MASALEYYGLEETKETVNFVKMFDNFFDCLNVRCISASVQHRKPDLRPYRSPDDERLKVNYTSYSPVQPTVNYSLSLSHIHVYALCDIHVIIIHMHIIYIVA